MIDANKRIYKQLQKESNSQIKPAMQLPKNQTKSVRLGFWESHKKLFLGLDSGVIETISKPKDENFLSRNLLLNVRDQIKSMKYLKLNPLKGSRKYSNVWTVQSPKAVWFVDICSKRVVGGGRLDRRLEAKETIESVHVVHENRVLCLFTSHSRVMLLLIRQGEKKVELLFLSISPLTIKNLLGHAQYGKYLNLYTIH